jgi:hypothetical protein
MERQNIPHKREAARQAGLNNQRYQDFDNLLSKEQETLKYLQEKLVKTKRQIRNWLHIMG